MKREDFTINGLASIPFVFFPLPIRRGQTCEWLTAIDLGAALHIYCRCVNWINFASLRCDNRCDNLDPYRTRPILKVGELSTHMHISQRCSQHQFHFDRDSSRKATRRGLTRRRRRLVLFIPTECVPSFSNAVSNNVYEVHFLSPVSVHSWVSISPRLIILLRLFLDTFSESYRANFRHYLILPNLSYLKWTICLFVQDGYSFGIQTR